MTESTLRMEFVDSALIADVLDTTLRNEKSEKKLMTEKALSTDMNAMELQHENDEHDEYDER